MPGGRFHVQIGREQLRLAPRVQDLHQEVGVRGEVTAQGRADLVVLDLGEGLELDLEGVGPLEHDLVLAGADPAQEGEGIRGVRGEFLPVAQGALADPVQDREEELLLAGEVLVDRRLGDARLLGDLGHPGDPVVGSGEDRGGAAQDLRPALLGRQAFAGVSGHGPPHSLVSNH
ncbi:hypothetical protein D3C86_1716550 [compost metagenome]